MARKSFISFLHLKQDFHVYCFVCINLFMLYNVCIDHQVVINLHHDGAVLSSRESKGGSCTVWNTSFLFDLPPGNISQLPLMLEFIIMQVNTIRE